MSITVTVPGGDALAAWFASRPAALDTQLGVAFSGIAQSLYARVLDNLSGAVVKGGSGKLADAIAATADDRSASVSLDTSAAPYGAALEFGASIPEQLVTAKNGKALAFVVGGSQVFAKHVMHPAFVLLPHSFLRAALADLAPDIEATLDDAVAAAIAS